VEDAREQLLGVLDIAGFESFEHNSLEQLLINLNNEHLQQHFNQVIFKQEIDESAKEGIQLPRDMGFMDNADCLELIDGKGGLLETLDETMNIPRASDTVYASKVAKEKASHPRLIIHKIARCGFGIKHFAGNVSYDCEGWLEKNADRPPENAADMLASSEFQVLREIGETMAAEASVAPGTKPGSKGKKAKSVTSGFRTSLKSLISKITAAEPHFIRCVKPNKEKVPSRFTPKMVMEQLLFSGVLATVQIRQQGYSHRIPHENFVINYRCVVEQLSEGELPGWSPQKQSAGDFKETANQIVEVLYRILPALSECAPNGFAIGKTKVFVRADAFRVLEEGRCRALSKAVVRFQCMFRGLVARRFTVVRKTVRTEINELLERVLHNCAANLSVKKLSGRKTIRGSIAWPDVSLILSLGSVQAARQLQTQLVEALQRADVLNFRNVDVTRAERIQRRLKLELETVKDVEKLAGSLDQVAMEKALASANGLNMSTVEAVAALQERLAKLKQQLPLTRAMEVLIQQCESFDSTQQSEDDIISHLQDMVDDLEQENLQDGSDSWLAELQGPALAKKITGNLHRLREQIAERKAAEAEKKQAEEAKKRAEEEQQNTRTLSHSQAEKCDANAVQEDSKKAEESKVAIQSPHDPITTQVARPSELQQPLRTTSEETLSAGQTSRIRKTKLAVSSPAEIRQLLCKLKRAADEYNVDALEYLLGQASQKGLRDEDALEEDTSVEKFCTAKAREVFMQLQTGEFLVEQLSKSQTEVEQHKPSLVVLRRLENLAEQLSRMPGYEDDASVARFSVQRALVERSCAGSSRKSVFQSNDPAELDMASRVFDHLSEFSGLKLQKSSHARSELMRHSKTCIKESLTQAPFGLDKDEYDAAATTNFQNLLVGMGDRPAQECQRNASTVAVKDLAHAGDALRDEVYVQVLKQLIDNPSSLSLQRGWELLQVLCQETPPKSELAAFVHAFVKQAIQSSDDNVATAAKSCLLILTKPDDNEQMQTEMAEMRDQLQILTKQLEAANCKNKELEVDNAKLSKENTWLLSFIEKIRSPGSDVTQNGSFFSFLWCGDKRH